MILVIGGSGAGKLDYVKSMGYTDEQIDDGKIGEAEVVYNLQDVVAADPMAAHGLLDALSAKAVVVCDEVGSGVIPATRQQRDAREQTGRLCVQLAKRASKVVRLVAGLPMVIKE